MAKPAEIDPQHLGIWAMTRLASASSIGAPMKMMLSLSSRE